MSAGTRARFVVLGFTAPVLLLAGESPAIAQEQPADAPAQKIPVADSLPPGVTMAMVEAGRGVFLGRGQCSTCHGASARGDIGPNLTDSEWLQEKGSFESILEVVLDGVPESASATGTAMPPRGDTNIDDAEVRAVAAYVWSMSHPDSLDSLPTGVTEAMIRRGEAVFMGEGGCALCHGVDATGVLGPNLTDGDWLDAKGSFRTIARIIARGVPAEVSTSGVEMPPRGGSDITPEELQQVAAYVWYMGHAAGP